VVAIGVKNKTNGIVAAHVAIALHAMDSDSLRLWIMARESKIELVIRDYDTHFSLKG
jgi:hypothetical protein